MAISCLIARRLQQTRSNRPSAGMKEQLVYLAVLLFSLLVYGGVVGTYLRSRFFSAFHPFTLYAMFHGLVFVVRPIFSVMLDYEFVYQAYEFTPTTADRITAIVAANIGFLAFAFFSFRPGSGGVEMRFATDPLLQDERYRLARYFVWTMAICAPLAIWSLAGKAGATFAGEASDMIMDQATGVAINTTGNGYFSEAQLMLVPLTTIVAWVFRFRLLALLPTILFVVFRASTGARGPFIAALFALGLFYLYSVRRQYPTLKVTMGLLAVGALFAAIGQDRGYALRTALGGETDSRLSFETNLAFMEGMDFANMEYLEYVVYVVPQRSQSYTYFTETLQLFTEPIPRVLWPGKPIGPPIKLFSMFDYGFPIGATWSLPGVGWMGLGWVGVVFLCGLWGYALGWIYRRFVESDQGTFKVAAYMCFMPIMVVAYRDGLVVTVFRQAIFYMTPILIWVAIARFFRVPSASEVRAATNHLLRRQRKAGADRQATAPAPAFGRAVDPGLAHLPPAVRRRRLALGSKD